MKLIKQNKIFGGINVVIFDNPYLTEWKDSTIQFAMEVKKNSTTTFNKISFSIFWLFSGI
jgi:hypothetical protein